MSLFGKRSSSAVVPALTAADLKARTTNPPKVDKKAPVPPTSRTAADIQAEAEAERKRFTGSKSGGRMSTMFTGPAGATGPVSSAVVRLLGQTGT